MRSGKFRKDNFNFDVKEAIEEIMSIQRLKADFCGIHLSSEMINFPLKSGVDQIVSISAVDEDMIDYVVCSDMQRLQQVILNLMSNALKFTQTGGFVKIICTYVNSLTDLVHREHHKYLLNSRGHGMIQVSVQDSGIGIKKEDQDKLFKLFGFLDTSKEMNTKGVGLGLHISQRITQ